MIMIIMIMIMIIIIIIIIVTVLLAVVWFIHFVSKLFILYSVYLYLCLYL